MVPNCFSTSPLTLVSRAVVSVSGALPAAKPPIKPTGGASPAMALLGVKKEGEEKGAVVCVWWVRCGVSWCGVGLGNGG